MVILLTPASPGDQGSDTGVSSISLNVTGAVFGEAVLNVVTNSVSYYGPFTWAVLTVLFPAYLVFSQHNKSKQSGTCARDQATTTTALLAKIGVEGEDEIYADP
ncbi:hypothetical protein F5Y01DRAFT_317252 [Xylaria sp. FL0043]|nr:hypothetical protein F5Y01DRAFT_317252 [Xylaria sp. FL0043]